jgi:GNAT superfamily N-acetyltransferase
VFACHAPPAVWAHLDIEIQHAAGAAPVLGLVLVALPPAAGAMTGDVELRLDGTAVATATLTCCLSCRTGTLDYVQVTADYRRLGYGRTLVAAALARAPGYDWTAPVPANPIAHAFCVRIDLPRSGPACAHRQPTEHA